jgi:hypothetical protein
VVAVVMGAHQEGLAVELLHDCQELVMERNVVFVPVGGNSLN